MSNRDWEICRIHGIPIKVNVSWFIVFAFVSWSLATGYLPEMLPGLSAGRYWVMGMVSAVLLFVSVLLHELGHSVVAIRYQIPIKQITLFIFGGVALMTKEPPGPRAEFNIAIAGPVVSFLLAGLLLGSVWWVDDSPSLEGLVVLGLLLGGINLQLGLFNLIPGFPLDGGRVLRAGLWAWTGDFYRATKQAAWAGQGFGVAMGLMGGLLILGGFTAFIPSSVATSGGWMMLIGLFLFASAKSSRRQAVFRESLEELRVGDVMIREVVSLAPQVSLQEAESDYFLRYGYAGFPVVEEGHVVGMMHVANVQAVPPLQRPWRRVGDVMAPWVPEMAVAPQVSVLAALEQMIRENLTRLVVLQDGQVVGLVTRSGIARFLELRGERRS